MDKLNNYNYKKLIDTYDYISFDVFDTLVVRNVLRPKDIFKIIEQKTHIAHFVEKRIKAEKKARSKSKNNECNLNDIYEEIKNVDYDIEELKEIEKEIEFKFIKRNDFLFDVYNYAISKGKEVYILTDMYLDKDFIIKILSNCGYEGYKNIYVSNELFMSKSKKTLYKYYLEENNIDPKKTLHIGDNYISDVVNAKEKGMNSIEYESVFKRSKAIDVQSLGLSIMQAITANKYFNGLEKDYYEGFGAKVIAPLIFSTTLWLKDLLVGSDNIYFLSRDGRLPYEVFNILKKELGIEIESKYIYTSRKAYQIPALILEHKNIFIDYVTSNSLFEKSKTVSDYLDFIDMEYLVDIENKLPLFGLKSLDEVVDKKSIHYVKKLISYLYPSIKKQMHKEIDNLGKYLRQEGLVDKENINLFDIGWRGSIQNAIQKILPNHNIDGYYLGTSMSVYEPLMSNTYGYLFDLAVPYNNFKKTFDNIMMYELFFSSPEPSLISFENKDGKIIPVFSNKETEQYKYLQKVHDGVLSISLEYVKQLEYLSSETINREELLDMTNDFIVRKNFNDLKKIQVFKSNIGLDERYFSFVTTFKEDYIKNNKKEFLKEIENSLWKNAFLVEGIETEEDYEKFKKQNNIKNNISNKRIFNKKNIIKGLKNPQKGLKIMKKLIKER